MSDSSNQKTKYFQAWTGIIAAIIAGTIAISNTVYTSRKTLELEKRQFESNLVLKLIVPNDTTQSIKNIKFFIEAGFLSKENEKLFYLFPKYDIKFPTSDTIKISPQNGYSLQVSDLFSAQITNDKGDGIKNARIKVFKNNLLKDTTCFSTTQTDENGLFKLALPKGEKIVKINISKERYKPINKIYFVKQLKNLRKIILESN